MMILERTIPAADGEANTPIQRRLKWLGWFCHRL